MISKELVEYQRAVKKYLSVEGQNNIEISKQFENGHILDTGMEVVVGLTHLKIPYCLLYLIYKI